LVIDVFVSKNRDTKAAKRFFARAIGVHGRPAEVTTDRSRALAGAITELLPNALHDTTQYANNRVEADHGRLKARLQPMRGLNRDRTASVIMSGHAFVQNVRRGHYELGVDTLPGLVLTAAFDELAMMIRAADPTESDRATPGHRLTQQSPLSSQRPRRSSTRRLSRPAGRIPRSSGPSPPHDPAASGPQTQLVGRHRGQGHDGWDLLVRGPVGRQEDQEQAAGAEHSDSDAEHRDRVVPATLRGRHTATPSRLSLDPAEP
jgi:IS6 family transposase